MPSSQKSKISPVNYSLQKGEVNRNTWITHALTEKGVVEISGSPEFNFTTPSISLSTYRHLMFFLPKLQLEVGRCLILYDIQMCLYGAPPGANSEYRKE